MERFLVSVAVLTAPKSDWQSIIRIPSGLNLRVPRATAAAPANGERSSLNSSPSDHASALFGVFDVLLVVVLDFLLVVAVHLQIQSEKMQTNRM